MIVFLMALISSGVFYVVGMSSCCLNICIVDLKHLSKHLHFGDSSNSSTSFINCQNNFFCLWFRNMVEG